PLPTSSTPSASPPSVTPDEQVEAWLHEGIRFAREGALDDVEESLRRALARKPLDAEIWNRLGVVLVRQGRDARAADAFTRALRVDPNHPEAHRNLAITRDRAGQPGQAVAHYHAFLQLSREDHPARDDVRRRLDEISALKADR